MARENGVEEDPRHRYGVNVWRWNMHLFLGDNMVNDETERVSASPDLRKFYANHKASSSHDMYCDLTTSCQ